MPMYDYTCLHGHTFEAVVPMDHRDEPIPCEGKVNQLVLDDGPISTTQEFAEGMKLMEADQARESAPAGQGLELVRNPGSSEIFLVRKVPCILKATRIEISHSHPGTMLDYGLCANRDAAREGRYDPDHPSTRGVRKSQI